MKIRNSAMLSHLKSFLFENKNTRQTVTKNVFWLSVSQIGSRLIRASVLIYAARVLGAAEYGIFGYIVGFAGFFTLFADIGVNSITIREIAGQPDKKNQFFSAGFFLKVILLILTTLLLMTVAPYFIRLEKAKALIPLITLLVIFDGIRDFAIAFMHGLEKMEQEAFIVILMNFAIALAGFAILRVSATAKAFIISYIISAGVATLISVFLLREQFKNIRRCFDKKLVSLIFYAALPIIFTSAISVFMAQGDILMLGFWRTSAEIGYYEIGSRIVSLLYTIPVLLAAALFPLVSKLAIQKDENKMKSINEKSMTLIFFIALPLAVGGFILAKPLIQLVFGAEYLPAVNCFKILLTMLLLTFPNYLLQNLVLAFNQQKKIILYMAIGSFGDLLLNFLLIPRFGIIGAAATTLFTHFVFVALVWRHIKKITPFKTLANLKKIGTATILMGILTLIFYKLGINVALNILFSVGIYGSLLFVFQEKILDEFFILLNKLRGA